MFKKIIRYLKRIESGFILNFLVHFATSIGLGFASFYFNKQGTALFKIVLMWALSPLIGCVIAFLYNKWNLKKQLIYGTLSYTLMSLSLLFFNQYSYIFYAIFHGCTMGFYWIPLNYLFFKHSPKNNHAKDCNIYFLIGPIFSILLPSIGALIIDKFSFKILFSITGFLTLIPLVYIYKENFGKIIKSNFFESDKNFSGLRLYVALNDGLLFFQGHFISVYVLLFLTSEYEIGGFMSYLALISLIITFFISKKSDKTQKRIKYLTPLMIMMGMIILSMIFIKNFLIFILVLGLYAIINNMSLPIRYAIPMDVKVKDIGFWRVAEFYGDLGRVLVLGLVCLFMYFRIYWFCFVIFALISFIIPIIVKLKIKNIS